MVEVPATSAMRRTVNSAGPLRPSTRRPAVTSRSRRSSGGVVADVASVAMPRKLQYNECYSICPRRSPVRAPPARVTNLALLAALLIAFASGVGAVAAGSASGRWVAVVHGVVGVAVVLLVPWKTRIVRRGLRRARRSRWASLLLAALASTALLTGLGFASGLLRSAGGFRGMWLHVALAILLLPLVVWHVLARPARPRRTDLSRRTLLRAGTLGAAAAAGYVATTAVVRAAGLPGASRRFTGSYETGSFDPEAMPTTSWIDDVPPEVDPASWRLVVADGDGERRLSLGELSRYDVRVRATLDCTGGWY